MKTHKLLTILLLSFILIGCGSRESSVEETQQEIVSVEEENGEVRIAIIDTGFSSKAIPKESLDEGKNYLDESLGTEDTYGHGTAIAGMILEHCPKAILVPLVSNVYEDGKILQVETEVLAQIIRDAVDVYHCDIINISAGLMTDVTCIKEAILYAEEKQVLVVASAGNDYKTNGEVCYYPAAYESVIAVGSINSEGEISQFSQRGEWVDCYAIGEEVEVPTLSGNQRLEKGTSYATARVTAYVANLIQENKDMDLSQIRKELREIGRFW